MVRSVLNAGDHATLLVDGLRCEMQLHHLSDLPATSSMAVVRKALGR